MEHNDDDDVVDDDDDDDAEPAAKRLKSESEYVGVGEPREVIHYSGFTLE